MVVANRKKYTQNDSNSTRQPITGNWRYERESVTAINWGQLRQKQMDIQRDRFHFSVAAIFEIIQLVHAFTSDSGLNCENEGRDRQRNTDS